MARIQRQIDPDDFAKRAAKYFQDCDQGEKNLFCKACAETFASEKCVSCKHFKEKPYTVSGLCLALGITKRKFSALKKDKAFAEAVEMALLRIEAYIEENCISGDIGGTLALALLKEHFDLGEKDENPGTITVLMSEEANTLAK